MHTALIVFIALISTIAVSAVMGSLLGFFIGYGEQLHAEISSTTISRIHPPQ